MSRATIKPWKPLMTPGGKLPHFSDASFQVPNQNEPTPGNPISQHKQFKGHSTALAHGKVPK